MKKSLTFTFTFAGKQANGNFPEGCWNVGSVENISTQQTCQVLHFQTTYEKSKIPKTFYFPIIGIIGMNENTRHKNSNFRSVRFTDHLYMLEKKKPEEKKLPEKNKMLEKKTRLKKMPEKKMPK